MVDSEVQRLRRLRARALRVRALSRALLVSRWTPGEPLLHRGGCAAWRIARAVSGRLRAHPYKRFQRDAGLMTFLSNSLAAKVASTGVVSRIGALTGFETELKLLARELDDARALTRASDLGELFGRCQTEVRALVAAIGTEIEDARQAQVLRPLRDPLRRDVPVLATTPECAAPADGGWPYLAF